MHLRLVFYDSRPYVVSNVTFWQTLDTGMHWDALECWNAGMHFDSGFVVECPYIFLNVLESPWLFNVDG